MTRVRVRVALRLFQSWSTLNNYIISIECQKELLSMKECIIVLTHTSFLVSSDADSENMTNLASINLKSILEMDKSTNKKN